MLLNPFTPTEIASQPSDFYGRENELRTLERSLAKGSVIILIIHGPMGIGKSSLMARARLLMEGFDAENKAASIIIVGNKSIVTIDDAARCVVQEMLRFDQQQRKIKFSFGSFFEFENAEVVQNFRDRHHLSVAMRVMKSDYLDRALSDQRLFMIAIDEAEKCPIPIAQLVRALVTHAQQHGIKGLRFIVSGVSPFYDQMLSEDPRKRRRNKMPGTPRTWTEDYPEETPEQSSPQTQTAAEKILPQVMRLILEVLRGHGDLLARFNAGLVPIRQGILTST